MKQTFTLNFINGKILLSLESDKLANFIDTYNERELSELEKEIDSIFREATKETQAKADAYFERIERLTKTKLQDLADGKITQAEYDSWLRGTIFQKDRFNAFISEYQAMINQYDSNALDLVSTKTPNVFANNANYVAYHLETGQKTDFNFQLWDKTTVDRLMKEDVTLLPPRKLSILKNNAWNMKAVKRQLTQGILQGESIQKIAKRMQAVTGMNKTNAVRNARTSMTTAQNAGRQARMEEAEEMGLIIKKVWVATLDGRTRDDHRKLDGATVGISDSFEVEGAKINYPGDIKAPPSELWNCRCTVIEKYEGITGAAEQRKLDTMKTDEYKAWKGAVEKGEVYEASKTIDNVNFSKTTNAELNKIIENSNNPTNLYSKINHSKYNVENGSWASYNKNNQSITIDGNEEAWAIIHENAHKYDFENKFNYVEDYVTSKGIKKQFNHGQVTASDYLSIVMNEEKTIDDLKMFAKTINTDFADDWFANEADAFTKYMQWGKGIVNEDTSFSDLSDIFSALTEDVIGASIMHGGHTSEYWLSNSMLKYNEMFADFVVIKETQNEKALELLKKTLPNHYNALEEVYDLTWNK